MARNKCIPTPGKEKGPYMDIGAPMEKMLILVILSSNCLVAVRIIPSTMARHLQPDFLTMGIC